MKPVHLPSPSLPPDQASPRGLSQKKAPLPVHPSILSNPESDGESDEEPSQVKFSLGDREFCFDAATLGTLSLEDLYEEMGLTQASEESDSEEDPVIATKEEKPIFPNIETFLWYLLYQQEGSNRFLLSFLL